MRNKSRHIDFLAEQLKRRHDSVSSYPVREFFPGLLDYLEFIRSNPYLLGLVNTQISALREKDFSTYTDLVKKTVTELQTTEERLIPTLRKIKNPIIKSALEEYNAFKEGRIFTVYQDSTVSWWYQTIILIRAVNEAGKSKLIKEFASLNLKKLIEEFTFSKNAPKLQAELERLNELREKTVWGSWDNLMTFYAVHNPEIKKELFRQNPTLEIPYFRTHSTFYERFKTARVYTEKWPETKGSYQRYLDQIHNYILEKLELDKKPQTTGSSDSGKIQSLIFVRPEDGNLYQLVINNDYTSPITVIRTQKFWKFLIRVAEGEKFTQDSPGVSVTVSNINYQKSKLYSKGVYNKTTILSFEDGKVTPVIELEVIEKPTFQRRLNQQAT